MFASTAARASSSLVIHHLIAQRRRVVHPGRCRSDFCECYSKVESAKALEISVWLRDADGLRRAGVYCELTNTISKGCRSAVTFAITLKVAISMIDTVPVSKA